MGKRSNLRQETEMRCFSYINGSTFGSIGSEEKQLEGENLSCPFCLLIIADN